MDIIFYQLTVPCADAESKDERTLIYKALRIIPTYYSYLAMPSKHKKDNIVNYCYRILPPSTCTLKST